MSDVVTLERKGAIAVVTVNNPPVNALGTLCAKVCSKASRLPKPIRT